MNIYLHLHLQICLLAEKSAGDVSKGTLFISFEFIASIGLMNHSEAVFLHVLFVVRILSAPTGMHMQLRDLLV